MKKLIILALLAVPFFAFATNDNVRICHRTGSGWVSLSVDPSAINGLGNGDHNSSNHQNGNDIIPPGSYDLNGRNWDTEGQAIWNNDCEVPPPYSTPYSSPYSTPYGTPYSSPYATPYETPYQTPYETPYGTPYATPEEYNTPYATPEEYLTPYGTPYATPEEYGTPYATPEEYGTPYATPEDYQTPDDYSTPSNGGGHSGGSIRCPVPFTDPPYYPPSCSQPAFGGIDPRIPIIEQLIELFRQLLPFAAFDPKG